MTRKNLFMISFIMMFYSFLMAFFVLVHYEGWSPLDEILTKNETIKYLIIYSLVPFVISLIVYDNAIKRSK